MNDFEAPQLKDYEPPRVFNTVTSRTVNYNMDFVEYLMNQETVRREKEGQPKLTIDQVADFRRELIAKLIIQGNAEAAIAHRPAGAAPATKRQQLNG